MHRSTGAQHNNAILASRIHLMQFAVTHSLDELLEETLNEAERLTDSVIGFYYFVDEDQKSLTLQNWSTRTKAEFCKAQGKCLHYSIDEAGVLVDCVYQRKAVVHNDYASLSHRKGMPEGHDVVIRELVVPVSRDGKLKAILGVGNKSSDYVEEDVETISLLADIAWEFAERKLAEETLRSLNRKLLAISNCNQVLLRSTDEQTLLNDICRIICNETGYRMAWVGYAENDAAKSVRPVAWAGVEHGYLATVNITWADTERGRGPTGTAIRSGVIVCIHDFATDPKASLWRERGLQRCYRSSIALPLKDESGNTFGALNIYSTEANTFTNKEEVRLLEVLADDLAFGINVLRACNKHKESNQRIALLSFALNNVREAAFLTDESACFQFVNDESCRLLGYTREELLSCSVADIDPDFPVELWPDHWKQLKTSGSLTFETHHRTKDGRIFPVEINANYFEYEGRAFNLALVRDITERKHMDNNLRESEERFRTLTEKSLVGVYIIQDNLFRYVNPAFAEIHGFTPEEIIDRLGPADFVIPEDRDRVLDSIKRRMAGEIEYSHQEFHIRRKDGSIRAIEAFGSRALHKERPAVLGTSIDITERKRYEEKLFQATERWERTFNAVPDLIAILDTDFRIVQANKAMSDRLRCTSARWTGQVCYAAIHKTDAPPSFCPHAQTLRDCREHIAEVTEEGLGGDFIVSTSPIFDSAGQLIGSVHVARDITERKRAEQAVEESRNFLDKIINSIADPILVKDRQHRWVLLNDACCDFVGYKRDELLGKTNYDFFPKKEADVFWSKDEIVFTSGMENVNEEELTDARGVVHTISTKKSLYTDDKGEQFIVGSIRDITERKHAEIRLNDQLHFLQQLLDSIPIPVFYKDIQGFYLGCNSAFETFNDLSRNQIMGKTVYELAPKDLADTYHEADSALFSRPGIQVYETSVMHKDGECHNVIFNKATYVDADGRIAGIVGALMDITALRKAEEERKLLEAQLHQAQKMEAIGQFAGGIAHDFNNILTAIIGYAEMIQMRLEHDSPLGHFVEQVLTSADRATELTKGLLAFSRRQVLHIKPIDLCKVVQGLRKMLERIIREDIDFRTTVFEKGLVVNADKGQIEQVLMNLVTNAKDAMPRAGTLAIEVSPAVIGEGFVHTHGFGEPGNYACISVTDTGHGMNEETKKRIFEPFFTTKEVEKGTGLGMAIIYGIIKQHNGFITVSSESGKGTTFRIYLPLITEEIKEVQGGRSEEHSPGGTETILLAEDEATVRELHKMILELAGYKVIEAVDGEDALGKFMERMAEVDIVATDVIMPKIDGKSLYEEIRKIRLDMKVLFMSGYTKDIIVARGILEDEFNYINKPVKPSELLRTVRDILDRN